jgi:hypothetical protein
VADQTRANKAAARAARRRGGTGSAD